MNNLWTRAALILVAVWAVAGGVIWWARGTKATPESIAQFVDTHSPAGLSPAERRRLADRVADQLNLLIYEQRREVRMSRKLDKFFRELNSEEQARFLDRTLPTGFKQMMEAFNKMEPARRKQFVEKSLAQMKEREGEEAPRSDDPNVRKMIEQGLRSFYSDANAEVKMDFAPLLEQMQHNLQGR